MTALAKLFSPIKIGEMEVKNRIAMAPMTTGWAPADGSVPDRMIDYLEARARGQALRAHVRRHYREEVVMEKLIRSIAGS